MVSTPSQSKRPNFLIIVADDLGFSDPGCFGSEIRTPNIDSLATSPSGVRLTNFHTASMCSPTRSMLLSGTDNHIAGLGQMEFWGRGRDPPVPWSSRPGYEGYLNFKVAALPEVLHDAGYYTCMSGKWVCRSREPSLLVPPPQRVSTEESWEAPPCKTPPETTYRRMLTTKGLKHLGLKTELSPWARGFERSFALLPGGASHYAYDPRREDGTLVFKHWASLYVQDDKRVHTETDLPEGYYSSDYYATKMVQFLQERDDDKSKKEKPFFAYLPFTAPHWPLQAPRENIERYRGVYDEGPDRLRESRLRRQKELGLLPEDVEAHPVVTNTKEWEDMTAEEKLWSARTMEVYAGMVDRMDENIGKVLEQIKASGEWDNTFVVFMSDNGAEGSVLEALPMTGEVIKKTIDKEYNNELDNLGNRDSFIWYGPRWAQAATAPSRMHKGYVTEGGIRCPAVVHCPAFSQQKTGGGNDRITNAFATVMDIMPTILDLAEVTLPGPQFRGRDVVPIKGKSWAPLLRGDGEQVHDEDTVIGWELFFHQAIRKGKWKAVFIPKPKGPEKWQLYNVEEDMAEIHDLAHQHPEVLDGLVKHWLAYVSEFGVFLREELEEGYTLPSDF